MDTLLIPLVTVTLLIITNALCVAAEFCMMTIYPSRIEQLVEQEDWRATALRKMLGTPQRMEHYVIIAQVGATTVSLVLGMYAAFVGGSWAAALHARWPELPTLVTVVLVLLAAGVGITLHLVIGEIVPRSLALQHTEEIVLGISPLMRLIGMLIFPFVSITNVISNGILWLLRVPPGQTYCRLCSPEALERVVTESYREGLLSDEEWQIIEKIFALDERRVSQVMTPRPRIVAIPIDITEEELKHILVTVPHSRFPVYEGDLDHIVGLLLTKDFVRQQREQPGAFHLPSLIRRDIPAVPEALTCDRLLMTFRQSRMHMALVFDEYGGTAGVVTLQDLVEEVVGKVHDEFEEVEPPPLQKINEGVFLARGTMLLDDLHKEVPEALPGYEGADEFPDVDTLGGFVVSSLGRPAQPGDHVEVGGVRFVVEEVSGYAVELVRIELQHSPPGEQGGQETPTPPLPTQE